MNIFSIRDIERLSGIKAHTLRIWEQRHGMCLCKRKESQHRYYDNEDLKQILRIAYLYHNGYKVSKIARLSPEDIKRLAVTRTEGGKFDLLINQLIESSLDYDQHKFENITNSTFQQLGFEESILKVFYPFFEKIGLLWMTEHVLPAHEHFSSYLIQKKIIVEIDRLPFRRKNDLVVAVFAPEAEHHEIPLLVMSYLLKKHGIKTVYFGSNTALDAVKYYAENQRVTHLFLHVITNFLNKEPKDYLNCLSEKFADLNLIVSGPVFAGTEFHREKFRFIRSCDEMMNLAGSL